MRKVYVIYNHELVAIVTTLSGSFCSMQIAATIRGIIT